MSSATEELDERSRERLGKACRKLIAVDEQLSQSRARTKQLLETKKRREANLLKLFDRLGIDSDEPCLVGNADESVTALKPSISKRKAAVNKATIQFHMRG